MVLPTQVTTAHAVRVTYPPRSLWPDLDGLLGNGPALSPPIRDLSPTYPVSIRPEFYRYMLHPAWPISVAIAYVTTVTILNGYNRRSGNRAWSISRSTAFWLFQLGHNVALTAFSAWTFAGMLHALQQSWAGVETEHGLAAAVDSLCKINGPRGLGRAATFDTQRSSWTILDPAMRLLGGVPDPTDVGRIWNEGLAFYGWLFYLSKFYEVVDTLLILFKGKQSSFLQTYHHTGAMISMWAGIRYMSPPIWLFTFLNSGIHTLMYTYYTLASLDIRVPAPLKRTLTAMQILQIVIGTTYATAHLFVAYDVPYQAAYRVVDNLSTAIPSMASSATAAATTAVAAGGVGSWLKKVALRAVGEEGLAENVANKRGQSFGSDAVHAADRRRAQSYISYKLDVRSTHCLDTSGQVFAILLNVAYLVPLFCLFLKFFFGYYQARTNTPAADNIPRSARDGARDLKKELVQALREDQGGASQPPAKVQAQLEKAGSSIRDQVQHDVNMLRNGGQQNNSGPVTTPSKSSKKKHKKNGGGDPRAYEVNPDLPKTSAEKQAEASMQPGQ